MKRVLCLTGIILPLLLLGQKIKVDTSLYENGQLYWRGNMLEVENSSSPIGLWEYWYEDGAKKLETWDDSTSKTFYLSMWLSDGQQVLKNGEGVLYEVEPLGDNQWDSSVYQIKDSIKQGFYRGYRLYPNHNYFQASSGQYDSNSQKTGQWFFKDSIIYKSWSIEYYSNDKLNGSTQHLYLNGNIEDSGQYKNDLQEGEWQFFNNDGVIYKDCNYKAGRYIGSYKAYYPSGKIKTEGQYIQARGYIKVHMRRIGRNKTTDRIENRLIDNKPFKDGVWKFFNSGGKLEKKIKYKKDKQII